MRLFKTKEQLKRLTFMNDMLIECKQRIETAKFDYNYQLSLDNFHRFLFYSESTFTSRIRRYENLYIWLEKRFTKSINTF